MDVQDCVNAAYPIPAALFFLGCIATSFYIKRKHQLGLGKTFKVLFGIERVRHDKVSTLLMLGTLFVPLALWLYLGKDCSAGIAG